MSTTLKRQEGITRSLKKAAMMPEGIRNQHKKVWMHHTPFPDPFPFPHPHPTAGPQCRALYDYAGETPDDLAFSEGDIIGVLDQTDPSGWWQGQLNGVTGFFPSNFVEMI